MSNISRLTDMGFTPEQSLKAMELANNDVEIAIGLLVGDLVEISNKEQIPVFDQPPTTQHPSNNMDEVYTSHVESQDQSDHSISSKSTSPGITTELPEPQERDENEEAVILTPGLGNCESFAAALLSALLQIDGFKSRLKAGGDNEFARQLKQLVQDTEGPNNYAVNLLKFKEDLHSFEENIQVIFDTICESFEDQDSASYIKNTLKSSVETLEDNQRQEISVIEIESDSRYLDIVETFNELFWGKELENLNNIVFSSLGRVLALCYIGDDLSYYQMPMLLRERIYPGVYSKEMLAKVLEINDKFSTLNTSKIKLSNDLMKLLIFQGKKISSFLNQSKEAIENETAKLNLDKLSSQLSKQKLELHKEMKEMLHLIEKCNIKNPENLKEGLTPYRLILLAFTETEYFYYSKTAKAWVYVNIPNTLSFQQDYVDFETVQSVLLERTGSKLIPYCLLYCKESELEESNDDLIDLDPVEQEDAEEKVSDSSDSDKSKKETLVDLE